MMRSVFLFLCLGTLASRGPADDKAPPMGDLKAIRGEWTSSFSRSPGSPDTLIQRTLEIGLKGLAESVRLSWAMYCGRSRITGGDSFVGRLSVAEGKGNKRILVFTGQGDALDEVEFELSGNELRLKGTIKGVDVSDGWKRKPATKK